MREPNQMAAMAATWMKATMSMMPPIAPDVVDINLGHAPVDDLRVERKGGKALPRWTMLGETPR